MSRYKQPALQNIPIRTELGRKIRSAFKPRLYMFADFSSMEMRIYAQITAELRRARRKA